MVFWLKFSVSSANVRVKDQELLLFTFFRGLSSDEASKPSSELWNHTRYLTEGWDHPMFSPRGHTSFPCTRNRYLSVIDRNCQTEIWIVNVSLACWGALITPMSYPNWKEPSTAVKTVKTKVPVICGEWDTGLGNTRQGQLPTYYHSTVWTSGRLRRLVLVPWYSQWALCSQQGHSYQIVRVIHGFPYTAEGEKSWG